MKQAGMKTHKKSVYLWVWMHVYIHKALDEKRTAKSKKRNNSFTFHIFVSKSTSCLPDMSIASTLNTEKCAHIVIEGHQKSA